MRLAGLTAALALAALPAAASSQSVPIALNPGEVLLNVRAEGIQRSRPDVMTITAGVVTTGATAQEALAANSQLANRLVDALRAKGIDPRDAKTAELSVEPRFEELTADGRERGENGRPRIVGYVANNRLELRLRDLSRAPELIDALFSTGANYVRGPSFSLADPLPAQRLARRAAVAAAREEADTYAEALNMRVARVLRVSERGEFGTDGGEQIIVTGSRIRRTPIEPGELSTTITVWIDYALVPR